MVSQESLDILNESGTRFFGPDIVVLCESKFEQLL